MNGQQSSYDDIAAAIAGETEDVPDRDTRMVIVVDRLWEALAPHGLSWVGFYIDHPEEPDGRRLILGPCRDKPACSPIGLHGACGRTLLAKQPVIVHDVQDLGADYIACDPRDQSEVVLPLLDDEGGSWGVLDLDSFDVGAFDERDAAGLRTVLDAARL